MRQVLILKIQILRCFVCNIHGASSLFRSNAKNHCLLLFAAVQDQSIEHFDPAKISEIVRYGVCVPAVDTGTQLGLQLFALPGRA